MNYSSDAPNRLDNCPNNENGVHRYFIHKVVAEYEPINKMAYSAGRPELLKQLYEKIEYTYLGCNCGSSIKSKVHNREA